MEDDRMVKKLTNRKEFGKRPAERPKNRWIDGILKDMEVLKVKNWKELTGNRKEWNKLVEKAKTNPGLLCCRRRRRRRRRRRLFYTAETYD
jgi:hypothetical protein